MMVKIEYLSKDYSFSEHTKFSEKRTHTCAYQRVKNVSFSENFAYALNE